jgi:NAD-dependent SIR2 family protein deacetylase
MGDATARQNYWARSMLGWPKVDSAHPNAAHHALARAEDLGLCHGLITQNVDRLHHRAGSQRVIELHGALEEVTCIHCGSLTSRRTLQQRLERQNPHWRDAGAQAAPDGDADPTRTSTADFVVAPCRECGGPLKPHVVFFGENVPRERVVTAYAWVDEADALLVVGSSLTVFSGFRFVKRAASQGKPIVIVNLGPTRGDELATLKIPQYAGTLLPEWVDRAHRS